MIRTQAAWFGAILLSASLVCATEINREVEAKSGEELVVDLETGARLTITAWDREAVSVRANFTGEDEDNVRLDVERGRGEVRVSTGFREHRRRNRVGGRVEVRVPRRFDLSLHSTGGSIEIEGVEGKIDGETMGGELRLEGLRGELGLTTMGGNVELIDSEVDGKVETYGGRIRLKDVVGGVEASTMGGNVIYDNVRPAAGAAGRQVKITTMGGNISVPAAPDGAELETMGGNIEVEQAAGFVSAKTMGGSILIQAVDGWVRASTMGGDIEVEMTGDPAEGKRDVRLSSQSGEVQLTLPEGMSMSIDVTLAYTKNSEQDYKIRSDFPLQIRKSEKSWDYSYQPAKKYIYGTGRVGGGEHRIKIETINGDVILRKAR